ncbi:hypothetical protein VTO42DRAFT_5784 [Malbranchea cinnamomea]
MARIEELPDDFDESLDLNKPPTTAAPPSDPSAVADLIGTASGETPFGIKEDRLKKDAGAPDLPPAMASVKSHTADEILDMMNKTPLFMTDISAADMDGENTALEAIRALQYEGTRAEIAQGFRETGNELAREKKWSDAREFYSKAIATLTGEDKWEKPKDPEAEARQQRETLEASYVNRALCQLELKNYRSTTLDCAAALKLNPKNIKAYYRSATALYALDKIPEAEDACTRGLLIDPNNKSLQNLSTKISARKAVLEQITAKKKAEEERRKREKLTLQVALRARNIKVRETEKPPELEDAVMHLSPDPLSPESNVVFPCVLLYPVDMQSDFIKAFNETDSINDHLSYIFPLPWDTKGEYSIETVDCYMETATGGLIKAGKKMSLLQILMGGKVEVVDGLVRINVVPTKKAKAWIEELKAKKAGGK